MFDYGGFPPQTYEYKYPAPGSPELAGEVASLLQQSGIACQLDANKQWDHGVFVPMILMVPDASIPIVSMSVLNEESGEKHIAIGEALQPLR